MGELDPLGVAVYYILLYAKVLVAGSNVAMCRDLAPIHDPEIEEERQHHVIIKPLHLTRAIYATAASL